MEAPIGSIDVIHLKTDMDSRCFGVAGIIAGTPAAAIVASYGGAVTAGSLCAILQSMGAAGLGIIGTVITGISGGAAATMTLDAIAGEEYGGYVLNALNQGERQASQPTTEQILAVLRSKQFVVGAIVASAALGIALTPLMVTSIVTALGFTAGGIVMGSPAAAIMAYYGGTVTAGSLCAILQSIGASGLSFMGTAIAGAIGGVATGGAAVAVVAATNRQVQQA
ncbi:hypothetical protein BGX31_001209 [Mortierella sp. GBA43]|nr:hypothetical protein BGX31_001209 [Mortierella sp. GBA43]